MNSAYWTKSEYRKRTQAKTLKENSNKLEFMPVENATMPSDVDAKSFDGLSVAPKSIVPPDNPLETSMVLPGKPPGIPVESK